MQRIIIAAARLSGLPGLLFKGRAASGRRRGQAMTEMVLLFPIFLIIVFVTAKIFALLVLVQKLEIASFYAARRWQLESHLNSTLYNDDLLKRDIEEKMRGYIGFENPAVAKFLNLKSMTLEVQRTQVWNVITLRIATAPRGIALLCKYPKQVVCQPPYGEDCMNGYEFICVEQGNHQTGAGKELEVIKYVPNRDRPIQFVLPGLK